jgi:cysteine-rich CPCC protein
MTDENDHIAWLRMYSRAIDRRDLSDAAQVCGHFLCPCCKFPTLSECAGDEICDICKWQDDGQDDGDAAVHYGGPNDEFTLNEARRNFLSHGNMYANFSGQRHLDRPHVNRTALINYIRRVMDGVEKLDVAHLNQLAGKLNV